MSEFKAGDTVVLKSGGPMMTIENVGNFGGAFGGTSYAGSACVWFEGTKPVRDTFPNDALEPAE